MGFRCKMNDRIDFVMRHGGSNGTLIADVCPHELIALITIQTREILDPTRIGQRI